MLAFQRFGGECLRRRFGVDCNEQLMRGAIEGDDGEATGGGGGGDLHG